MAVSHEEAVEIVRARFEPGWTHGTFCLDDRFIVENEEFYVFEVGAREDLIDGNPDYAVAGGVPTVYKPDGLRARASRPATSGSVNIPRPWRDRLAATREPGGLFRPPSALAVL